MKSKNLFLIGLGLTVATAMGAEAWNSWKLPADPTRYQPGRGVELVIANCSLCHSADYVATQPPLGRPGWKATVEKMRVRYGAPIKTNNVEAIVEYLANAYGPKAP